MKKLVPYFITAGYAAIPGILAYVFKASHSQLGQLYLLAAVIAIVYMTYRDMKQRKMEQY